MPRRRKSGPRTKYVAGSKGSFKIQIFVDHPPQCVCATCPKRRRPDQWADSFPVRIQRKSIYPNDALHTSAYALQVKRDEEERLRRAVAEEEKRGHAVGDRVSVGKLCDLYRDYQRSEGCRLDRDEYRIRYIEKFFGRDADAALIGRAEYNRFKESFLKRKVVAATVLRYTNTLVAIFNNGLKEEVRFEEHGLKNLKRPKVRVSGKPVTFTTKQVSVLLGPAMDKYERQQAKWCAAVEASGKDHARSQVSYAPMRGFCLVAYLTLMRPVNNRALDWAQITLGPKEDEGTFRLDEHKNSNKGIRVEAPLHAMLVRYLRSIAPSERPVGPVHANPQSGNGYVTFTTQWEKLVEIANTLLGPEEQLTGRRAHFYTWRHTGSSRMAAAGVDPIKIVRMLGDTSLKTVMDHYFDASVPEMAAALREWVPVMHTTSQTADSEPN